MNLDYEHLKLPKPESRITAGLDQKQRESLWKLLGAIRNTGPAPCHRCPLAEHCATEPAACEAFIVWVGGGDPHLLPRQPTRDLFDFAEGISPFAELTHSREISQIADVLMAEALEPQHPPTPATKAEYAAYRAWLDSRQLPVGPSAMSRLCARRTA